MSAVVGREPNTDQWPHRGSYHVIGRELHTTRLSTVHEHPLKPAPCRSLSLCNASALSADGGIHYKALRRRHVEKLLNHAPLGWLYD